MPDFCATSPVAAFQSFLLHDFLWLFLLWGNAKASPSAGERERMSLFKFSNSGLCCCRRRGGSGQTTCLLLPCRGAASIPGTHSICEVGSALGWVARGVGEVSKVGSQLRSPLFLNRCETKILPFFFNSKETHPPCHPKSVPCTWAETVLQASGLLRLPEDLPVSSERSAGAFPKSSR